MADQADMLRRLLTTAVPTVRADESTPNIVAVTGGRSGVGTTTVAVNLATALADVGERVLVVDASQNRNDMLGVAGIRRRAEKSLADVIAGKCSVVDALVAGPLGTKFLVGSQRRGEADFNRHFEQQLLAALDSVNNQFDVVLVDTGCGLTQWTRRIWLRSRVTVVVTTADEAPLMDAYAMLKLSVKDSIQSSVGVVINQALNDSVAADALGRLVNSCRRFLSLEVASLPSLPLVDTDGAGAPVALRVWEEPDSPFGHAALWLARAVDDCMKKYAPSGVAILAVHQ